MNDENNATPDLSKVISIIMENPDIIERISSLVKSESQAPKTMPSTEEIIAEPAHTAPPTLPERSRRSQLLGALKPYVKKERAQAIDSVIAIADMLDMMRRK